MIIKRNYNRDGSISSDELHIEQAKYSEIHSPHRKTIEYIEHREMPYSIKSKDEWEFL